MGHCAAHCRATGRTPCHSYTPTTPLPDEGLAGGRCRIRSAACTTPDEAHLGGAFRFRCFSDGQRTRVVTWMWSIQVIRDTTGGHESYLRSYRSLCQAADLLDPATTLKLPFDNIRMLPEDEDPYNVVDE